MCYIVQRLEHYGTIHVLFANGLYLAAAQHDNTMMEITVQLRALLSTADDDRRHFVKPHMPSMINDAQPDDDHVEDTRQYAQLSNIPVDERIMAGNDLADALFPVGDDDESIDPSEYEIAIIDQG